jgi:hypothetical protein
MKRWIAASLIVATASYGSDADVEAGRTAAMALGKELRARLEAAVASGGIMSAVEVCHIEASGIASSVSARVGATVGRTALRVRNPSNAAAGQSRVILQDFVRRAAAGEPIAGLEHAERVALADGATEVRFWKAIPMEPTCAACHGEFLAPEVEAVIAHRYPADEARGFKPGEIRGAFDIRWTMPAGATR